MSNEDQVLIEREGHVAVVTLNRPERLNAITGPMLDKFSKVLLELDEVHDAVVSGEPNALTGHIVAARIRVGSDASTAALKAAVRRHCVPGGA